jgi:glycosyltransferase involved in cell wall biosynthesis
MFNEEENIEHAVRFAEAALAYMTSDYEILIINDASTDRSGARGNRRVSEWDGGCSGLV